MDGKLILLLDNRSKLNYLYYTILSYISLINHNLKNMKKILILAFTLLISTYVYSQKGVRIGYVDTEYILQNLPEYQDTVDELEEKADTWKIEIEKRFSDLENRKADLNAERLLLTDELIQEKEEEIDIEKNDILDYQQKRFGPRGDLIIKRKQLIEKKRATTFDLH